MTEKSDRFFNLKFLSILLAFFLAALLGMDAYVLNHHKQLLLKNAQLNLVQQIDHWSDMITQAPDYTQKQTVNPPIVFQAYQPNKVLIWDSSDSSRSNKILTQPHFLLRHALQNPIKKDLIEFENHLGAFKRTAENMIVLGAVPLNEIMKPQADLQKQLFSLNLILILLIGAATLIYDAWTKKQLIRKQQIGLAAFLGGAFILIFTFPSPHQTNFEAIHTEVFAGIYQEPVPESQSPTLQNTRTLESTQSYALNQMEGLDSMLSLKKSKSEKVYLLYPSHKAVLTDTQVGSKGYPLSLRFEVDPKGAPCKLELRMRNELVLERELPGNSTGLYQETVVIRKPAVYRWRVVTKNSKSELQSFTIRK